MSSAGPQVATTDDVGPSIQIDPEGRVADVDDIYLDGTLVLVGCGKAKRDPDDPQDLHAASVGPDEPMPGPGANTETGPAWKARDLYTSNYFRSKRDFAEVVTTWSGEPGKDNLGGWAILSAEHYVLYPWQDVKPYEKSIDDIGDDPTDPDDWADESFQGRRRPDGREIVTEMDQWATLVASELAMWVASFREHPDRQSKAGDYNPANTLLVLAGQDYVEPLRKRGVFEYGIDRMAGDPNLSGPGRDGLGVTPRYLFEEIDAAGNGEQMGWLSDATSKLEPHVGDGESGEVAELGRWGGLDRECTECGATHRDESLDEYDGVVYCDDCAPEGQCARCDRWTSEKGLGSFYLCPDCQTEHGGMKDPVEEANPTEQSSLPGGNQ